VDKYQYSPQAMQSMEASPIPFAVYQFIDRRVVTLVLSAGFCELLGYEDRAKAYYDMDHDMYRDTHPDDMARIADAAVRFATDQADYNVIYRSRIQNSKDYRILHAIGKHFFTETGVRLAMVWYTDEGRYSMEKQENDLAEILSRDLWQESMTRRTSYDTLTGMPNMTYFFELAEAGLKKIRESGKQPAVLFVDLCGMRNFNSKHGFSQGDRLLQEFARLLVQAFSNENCSRFGQDHFAVFTEREGLEEKLERLFEEAAKINGGNSLPVRAGIFPVPGNMGPDEACDRAKMACNTKRNSFDSVYILFDEKLLEETERNRYIVENHKRAIAEKWIQVYYQPIVRSANGRVCDEEALARWIDPEKGFLSPADFIPALEEAKKIYRLDLYVCEQVLEKMKKQADAGLYVVPTSVNLSRADFDSCDIVEEIRKRVDASGIGRDKLTIEITESIVGSDFEFIKEQVERFQKLGFKVWMDDFGSGYSSLDVLQNIHFDVIKFDMRFMKQLDSSGEAGRIILTELTKMAIGLGIDTVCEGVEEEEQVKFLQTIGCTKLQGFYFCRPIPPEEIIERNRKGIQIGFENPEESEYYTAIGRLNLYDMTGMTNENDSSTRYFDTPPMAILEVNGDRVTLARCNQSYREFLRKTFGLENAEKGQPFGTGKTSGANGAAFLNHVIRCGRDGIRDLVDEKIGNGMLIHAFLRRAAVNPVTGTAAVAVAVLSLTDEKGSIGTTYAQIARALSADYAYLYYVNLETEEFVEYRPDPAVDDLGIERRGTDFFAASRHDALEALDPADREAFVRTFTKENVTGALDAHGVFTVDYRLMTGEGSVPVSMKIVRMREDRKHIIIGVRNVEA